MLAFWSISGPPLRYTHTHTHTRARTHTHTHTHTHTRTRTHTHAHTSATCSLDICKSTLSEFFIKWTMSVVGSTIITIIVLLVLFYCCGHLPSNITLRKPHINQSQGCPACTGVGRTWAQHHICDGECATLMWYVVLRWFSLREFWKVQGFPFPIGKRPGILHGQSQSASAE